MTPRRTDIAIAAAATLAGLALPLCASRHLASRIDDDLEPALSRALGEPVSVDAVEVGATLELVVGGLAIGDRATVEHIAVRSDVGALIRGRLVVDEIAARGAHLTIRVDRRGQSDLMPFVARARDLAQRVRGPSPDVAAPLSAPGEQPFRRGPRTTLAQSALTVQVDGWGEVEVTDVSALAAHGRGRVVTGPLIFDIGGSHTSGGAPSVRGHLARSAADFDVQSGRVTRFLGLGGAADVAAPGGPPLHLQDLSVSRGVARGERARVDARVAGLQGAAALSVSLVGTRDAPRLEARADGLPLGVLGPLLPEGLDVARTRARGTAQVAFGAAMAFEVDADLDDLVIDDRRFAAEAFALSGHLSVKATRAPVGGRAPLQQLAIDAASFTTSGLTAQARGTLDYLPGEPLPESAVLSLDVPRTGCAGALAAMPSVFRTRLAGLDLSGTVAAQAELHFERKTVSDTRLDIHVDADHCQVVRDAADADPRSIAAPPADSAVYVATRRLPKYVPMAFVATEDARFFRHHGFDPAQIERSLAVDLHAGAFVRGGSTISQQLVKNAFLTHERTLARKFQESVLTWRVEAVVDKDAILERYMNIIELGPDIFGIEAAAHFWFDKPAAKLSVREAAFLAALTPAPRTTSRRVRRAGGIDPQTGARIDQVLEVMHRHRVITERALRQASSRELSLSTQATAASLAADLVAPSAGSDAQEQPIAEVALER